MPSSFQYQLSTNSGTIGYSITGLPTWLSASSTSGTVTTSPTTITFTVNASANSLPIGSYNATISFSNTTNGKGDQTRNAALTVNSGGTAPSAPQTWVSGAGDDGNDCTLTAPCQTFAGALPKTAAGGEINCLDSAGYGMVTINKAITIICDDATAGVLSSNTNGIIVNAGAGDVVVLRGLDFEGLGTGFDGISFIGGGKLFVENGTIHNFTGNGISFTPNGTAFLFVKNVYARANGANGILIQPSNAAAAKVSISGTELSNNAFAGFRADGTGSTGGIFVSIAHTVSVNNAGAGFTSFSQAGSASTKVLIIDCVASNNNRGLNANGAAAVLRIGSSVVARNTTGVDLENGAIVSTYGNNQIDDNVSAGAALDPFHCIDWVMILSLARDG